MKYKLYLLGFLGAFFGAVGDVAGLSAARGKHFVLYTLTGLISWTACYPVWYWMCRLTNGSFSESAASWTVSGAAFATLIAAVTDEAQNKWQWLGLILIIGGAAIRGLCK